VDPADSDRGTAHTKGVSRDPSLVMPALVAGIHVFPLPTLPRKRRREREVEDGRDLKRTHKCNFLSAALLACICWSIEAYAEAAPTPEQLDQGREIYEDNCMTCHGRDMVSPGLVTSDLRKFPKDDPACFRGSVLDGKGTAMPAFRDRMSGEEVDLLWAYVRGGS
jgi:hypothetical protein